MIEIPKEEWKNICDLMQGSRYLIQANHSSVVYEDKTLLDTELVSSQIRCAISLCKFILEKIQEFEKQHTDKKNEKYHEQSNSSRDRNDN